MIFLFRKNNFLTWVQMTKISSNKTERELFWSFDASVSNFQAITIIYIHAFSVKIFHLKKKLNNLLFLLV